jgi:3-oxoacyl-ACP reductase-like protein
MTGRLVRIHTHLVVFSFLLTVKEQILCLKFLSGVAGREGTRIGQQAAAGAGFLLMAAGAAYVKRREGRRPPFIPPPTSLVDETIVITGASTGPGLESAKRLAAGGANVILTARSESKGEAAVREVRSYLSQSIGIERNSANSIQSPGSG